MAPSPANETPDELLMASDSLFVQQEPNTSERGGRQREQTASQGSRSPVDSFLDQHVPGQQSAAPSLPREPAKGTAFTGNFLSRPIFKTFELKQGFEYGPAIPIAPDQFTRRLCSPAPVAPKETQQEHRVPTAAPKPITKPLSPRALRREPQLDDHLATQQRMSPPPPRSHMSRSMVPPKQGPNDRTALQPPLEKTDHPQVMAPPTPQLRRAELPIRTKNPDNRIAPVPIPRAPYEEHDGFPPNTGLDMPLNRNTGQHEPVPDPPDELERSRTHNRHVRRESKDGSHRRPSNNGRADPHHDHHSREISNPQITNIGSHHPPRQFARTSTGSTANFASRSVQPQPSTVRGPIVNETLENEPAHVPRSPNGSRRRSTHQAPVSALASSEMSEVQTSSPANLATKNTHEFSTSMARAINHFNISQKTALEHQKAHYKRKLRAFQRKVVKLVEALEGVEKRDVELVEKLQSSRDSNRAMADQIKALEVQVELEKSQKQSLEEDHEAFRDQSAKDADGDSVSLIRSKSATAN